MMHYEAYNLSVTEDEVIKLCSIASLLAKRNRSTYHQSVVSYFVDDINLIPSHIQNPRWLDTNGMLGKCIYMNSRDRNIWLRPGREAHEEAETVIHEIAHAYTNPKISHGHGWRNLYLMLYAIVFDGSLIDGFERSNLMTFQFEDHIDSIYHRYSQRGFSMARETTQHLRSMELAVKWYRRL